MDALTPVSVGSADHNLVAEWLYREAMLFDRGDMNAWLALVEPDIQYRMPVRRSATPGAGGDFSTLMYHFDESHSSLTARIKRLGTEHAWAEQPASRTRHLVSNVLVHRAKEDELHAASAFILTRGRDDDAIDILSGEREDVFRKTETGLKLARRLILIDQTVLKTYNLSVFF